MIITCPDCETQFLVNNADIIPDGRDVRCSRCDYQWYVAPSSEGASDGASERALDGDADESVAPVAPDDASAEERSAPDTFEQASGAAIEQAAGPTVREMVPDASAAIAPEDDYQSRLPVPVSVRGPGWRLLLSLVMLLSIGAISVGLYVERARIVDMWPPARAVYEVLGLEVADQSASVPLAPVLQLRDVRVSGSEAALVLSGLVVGPSAQAMMASIGFRIEDAAGAGLYQAVISMDEVQADPHGARFAIALPTLPDSAHGLIITLE